MSFTFGFYNSLNGDRKYNAEQISAIFDGLIHDGVFDSIGDIFATTSGEGLQVIVGSGKAWFHHTWNVNDAALPLNIDPPDVLLSRIDAVVLEVNNTKEIRSNSIKIIKGTPATHPSKPALTKTEGLEGINQYALSYVTVDPNATAISPSKIEINVGKSDCPFVTSIVQSTDIDALFNQWNGEFDEWFENLKMQLTDDVVANLQRQIDEKVNKTDKASTGDAIFGESDSLWMTPKTTKESILANVKKKLDNCIPLIKSIGFVDIAPNLIFSSQHDVNDHVVLLEDYLIFQSYTTNSSTTKITSINLNTFKIISKDFTSASNNARICKSKEKNTFSFAYGTSSISYLRIYSAETLDAIGGTMSSTDKIFIAGYNGLGYCKDKSTGKSFYKYNPSDNSYSILFTMNNVSRIYIIGKYLIVYWSDTDSYQQTTWYLGSINMETGEKESLKSGMIYNGSTYLQIKQQTIDLIGDYPYLVVEACKKSSPYGANIYSIPVLGSSNVPNKLYEDNTHQSTGNKYTFTMNFFDGILVVSDHNNNKYAIIDGVNPVSFDNFVDRSFSFSNGKYGYWANIDNHVFYATVTDLYAGNELNFIPSASIMGRGYSGTYVFVTKDKIIIIMKNPSNKYRLYAYDLSSRILLKDV